MFMLMEEEYKSLGCSCGVPLVSCSMGPTCPACGMVLPELAVQVSNEWMKPRYWKPGIAYKQPPKEPIRLALGLKLKDIWGDSIRREKERCAILDAVCQLLGYPAIVEQFAWFYYRKIRRIERVHNSRQLLAATVYAAAREVHTCMSLRSIVIAFTSIGHAITMKEVVRVYSRFKQYLPNPNAAPETYLFKIMSDLVTLDNVRGAIAEAGLDMDEAFVHVIQKAKAILQNARRIPGRGPIKCAAAIYLAFIACNARVAAITFAEIVEASPGNLRHAAKQLKG